MTVEGIFFDYGQSVLCDFVRRDLLPRHGWAVPIVASPRSDTLI